VIAANPGSAFHCTVNHEASTQFSASVVASAVLPATTSTDSVSASLLALTLHVDGAVFTHTTPQVTDVNVSFSPGDSVTVPTATLSISGDTKTVGLSHASATITPVSGNLGTVVPVGISAISFRAFGGVDFYTCVAVTGPAPVGSVLVSGTVLSVTPASPVAPGTTVTLTASVVPATKGGQVTFFDTVGGNKTTLGTAVVPTSGATAGIAKLDTTNWPDPDALTGALSSSTAG
jgi:hypothetical protein